MIEFDAKITGDEEFKRAMGDISRFALRPRLAMRDMAASMEEHAEMNFREQGRPKWEKLSPKTIEKRIGGKNARRKDGKLRKSAQGKMETMKILQDRGALAASVHSKHGDDYAMIGAGGGGPGQYARIHQLGGLAGRGRNVPIPARPYLPFNPDMTMPSEVERELIEIAERHLKKAYQKP
uniref:Phage virion morphogenesis (Putative tail completion) protein n=1 Tax=Candidatus Kentrum sp. TC TaxID=2126339 RepID=A0A451AGI6_9GAMM|nr:MAG: phage virion morphogenesis (putative tail completion) protein [Candidatus Kentron sp. TC]